MAPQTILIQALRASLSADALHWLESARTAIAGPDLSRFLSTYTSAGRVGDAPVVLSADASIHVAPGLDVRAWSQTDLVRLLLLLERRATFGENACASAATACYEQGDASEHRSWLRTIAWLPSAEQFMPLAIDACRTNIQPVFQAIACENPFPAAWFPERSFNQMVLKALFNDVAMDRIVGLSHRRNPELARMAGDYADERRAAGRTVPADIGHVL